MFCAFHRHLKYYDQRRFCHCNACEGAADLTLKVVSHYGEYTGYTVKNFSKLIGKDIIVAHQLLKNDIEKHEYWLITGGLTEADRSGVLGSLRWQESRKATELGEIPFWYYTLSHLKENLPPPPQLNLNITNRQKVLEFEREYPADILKLLHAVVDFENRKDWQPGVKEITDISDPHLMRLGTKHRCVLDKGQSIVYSSSFTFTAEHIVYAETSEKKDQSVFYTFDKKTDEITDLKVEYFIPKKPFAKLAFDLFKKKKLMKGMARGLEVIGKIAAR
jgi:hypothetical protein